MPLREQLVAFEVTKYRHSPSALRSYTRVGLAIENDATVGGQAPLRSRPSADVLHHRQELAA